MLILSLKYALAYFVTHFSILFLARNVDPTQNFSRTENYFVSNTDDNLLKDNAKSCAQGLNNDETFTCKPFKTSHMVCGHYGVFTFVYPNYEISETSTSLRMQVRRTGGGYGHVEINYYIKHFTTNDSDVIATAPYTTVQQLVFADGKCKNAIVSFCC